MPHVSSASPSPTVIVTREPGATPRWVRYTVRTALGVALSVPVLADLDSDATTGLVLAFYEELVAAASRAAPPSPRPGLLRLEP